MLMYIFKFFQWIKNMKINRTNQSASQSHIVDTSVSHSECGYEYHESL